MVIYIYPLITNLNYKNNKFKNLIIDLKIFENYS